MQKTSFARQLVGKIGVSVRRTLWVCTNNPQKFEELLRSDKRNHILDESPSFDFFVMKSLNNGGKFYEVQYSNDIKALVQALDFGELKRITDKIRDHKRLDINEDPLSISSSNIENMMIGPMFFDRDMKDWIWNITKYRTKQTGKPITGKPMQVRYLEVYHPNGFFEIW